MQIDPICFSWFTKSTRGDWTSLSLVIVLHTFPSSCQSWSHLSSLSQSSLRTWCSCPFSLQCRAQTRQLISYFRQEEEDWHSLVDFSFLLLSGNMWNAGSLNVAAHCQPLCRQCLAPELFPCALLKAVDLLLALTAVLFLRFSLALCHRHTQNCKIRENPHLCQNPGWMPLLMQQRVPVFQLEAAVVTALSHHKAWLSYNHLKRTSQRCELSGLSRNWPRSIFYNYTRAKWFCTG